MHDGLLANRYRLDTRLGAGGFGEVWAGTDVTTGREVAVKILKTGTSASAEQRHRFAREVRVIGALEHPNVVRIFDVFEDADGSPAYAMERLYDETFRDLLVRAAPLALSVALDVLLPVVDAGNSQTVLRRSLRHVGAARQPSGSPCARSFAANWALEPTPSFRKMLCT